jgi:hypothetical protein
MGIATAAGGAAGAPTPAEPPWSTSPNATRVISWSRRGQAPLGLQQPVQDQQPPHQLIQGVAGDPPVRMVGGLGEKRVGLSLLLKTHPVRVHPRPCSSRPRLPHQQRNQTQSCPKGLPVLPGPSAARLGRSCAVARCRRPVGRPTGVYSTGCALRLVLAAHAAAPSSSPGAARSGIARGPVPSRPLIPGPAHLPWEGRSTAHALDLERTNAAPDRSAEVTTSLAAPLVTTGRSHCEVPSICDATVGGEAAPWQAATACRPRWTALRR